MYMVSHSLTLILLISPHCSTLDTDTFDYINVIYPKERSPQVWQIPSGILCLHTWVTYYVRNGKYWISWHEQV